MYWYKHIYLTIPIDTNIFKMRRISNDTIELVNTHISNIIDL